MNAGISCDCHFRARRWYFTFKDGNAGTQAVPPNNKLLWSKEISFKGIISWEWYFFENIFKSIKSILYFRLLFLLYCRKVNRKVFTVFCEIFCSSSKILSVTFLRSPQTSTLIMTTESQQMTLKIFLENLYVTNMYF
jgi:hypothetical protein